MVRERQPYFMRIVLKMLLSLFDMAHTLTWRRRSSRIQAGVEHWAQAQLQLQKSESKKTSTAKLADSWVIPEKMIWFVL